MKFINFTIHNLAPSLLQKTYPSLLITCLPYWITCCKKNC